MIVEDQGEVIEFLSRSDAYGADGGAIERQETHASIIFLTTSRAYKLKRAVRFPYLDYSTAELRRNFCESEVSINRRTAPDLYLGVVPVVRRPGGNLSLGGEGTPVDWLVEMQRFDENALFDHLATAGRLDRFAIESLADVVARFHQDAERRPDAGGAAGVEQVLKSNLNAFAECDPAILDRDRIEAVMKAAWEALDRLAPLLDRRRDAGFVRQCHGDLHLRNIVVREGRAVLFDAIEFDPMFANIDVVYDLAFLVMDLLFRDLGKLASMLLNRYLDNTGDAGGLPALPLFLSMRAAIRSHVDAIAAATQTCPEQSCRLVDAARRYLDLAAILLSPPKPRLVAIGGLSGTGKSRLARDLAPRFAPAPGARVVRTDSTRKRLAGVALNDRLGRRDYSEEMGRRTYQAVYDEARLALAAGCPVIADAVFARPEEREAIARVAADAAVPFHGLWLEAAPHLLEQRVTGRRKNVSDATAEVVRLQLAYDLGVVDWPRLDSSGDAQATVESALRLLSP